MSHLKNDNSCPFVINQPVGVFSGFEALGGMMPMPGYQQGQAPPVGAEVSIDRTLKDFDLTFSLVI